MDGGLAGDLARPVVDLGVWFVGSLVSIAQHAIAGVFLRM